jgi:hypothetical protein
VLELAILGGGAAALYVSGQRLVALVATALILIDYALSYDRIARLLGT